MIWSPCFPAAATAAKSLQSCPTLCIPIDGSPLGSAIPGILQARTLKWVAISFSNAWKWKGKVKSFSHVWLFTTPWTAAYQAPPSMGFSRPEYWSGFWLFALLWNVAHQVPLFLVFSQWENWSGLLCLPPGIFLIQGLNPPYRGQLLHPLHCRWILYCWATREAPVARIWGQNEIIGCLLLNLTCHWICGIRNLLTWPFGKIFACFTNLESELPYDFHGP